VLAVLALVPANIRASLYADNNCKVATAQKGPDGINPGTRTVYFNNWLKYALGTTATRVGLDSGSSFVNQLATLGAYQFLSLSSALGFDNAPWNNLDAMSRDMLGGLIRICTDGPLDIGGFGYVPQRWFNNYVPGSNPIGGCGVTFSTSTQSRYTVPTTCYSSGQFSNIFTQNIGMTWTSYSSQVGTADQFARASMMRLVGTYAVSVANFFANGNSWSTYQVNIQPYAYANDYNATNVCASADACQGAFMSSAVIDWGTTSGPCLNIAANGGPIDVSVFPELTHASIMTEMHIVGCMWA